MKFIKKKINKRNMNRGKADRIEEWGEKTVIMGTDSTLGLIACHQKH